MKQQRWCVSLIAALVAFLPAFARADVKTQQKTQMKFEGMMGRMMGMFGGKAMKEGMIETVAVKGNRKATIGQDAGEIIDLDEEVVYRLDMRRKTYRRVTFAELRRELEEAQAKAAEAMKGERPAGQAQPDQSLMQIDFDLKESGQKRQINGYDCREVIMTVTMHEKGKPIEQAGGSIMTANIWLAPEIPYLKEIREFDRRYAEKLRGPVGLSAADAQQLAAAMAIYPGMQEMMAKLEAQKVNMNGTEILTVLTMASVKSAAEMQREQSETEKETAPTTGGGIGGLIGRRLLKKKAEQPAEAGQAANRATILTIQHELLSAEPAAGDADVALPAGFKAAK
jgi:hypothetical protein